VSTWAADGAAGASTFPPIAEYGFLSDCETCALVAPNSNIEWLCLPRFDSPSVFGAMLDRDAGTFRLAPADVEVPAARRYLPGTNVLETSWGTSSGWIIVRDVLLIGPWHHEHERSHTHRRAPTDYDADHVLVRLIRCVNGEVQVTLDCEPRFDYGRTPGVWDYTGTTYHEAVCRCEGTEVELTLASDMNMGFEGPRVTGRTLMKEGDTLFVALSWSEHPAPTTYEEAYDRLVWTAHHWQHWLDHGTFPDHPWRTALQRSALTLKGLSYAPTGALVAAATTSLPETPGGERNWDYRYTWIRDATFMLWGLYTLGFDWEANDFFFFIADVAESEQNTLQIMYGIDGEDMLEEHTLDHLSGYEGARPVRIGNGAYDQDQHDVWGALLDSVYLHTKSRDHLPERIWPILKRQVEAALENWREPDRGIWEIRGEPQHFTSSKLMCWVAADRGARLAEIRDELEFAARWQSAADEIKNDILENALDDRSRSGAESAVTVTRVRRTSSLKTRLVSTARMPTDGSQAMTSASGRARTTASVTRPVPAPMSTTGPVLRSASARRAAIAGALEVAVCSAATRSKNSADGEYAAASSGRGGSVCGEGSTRSPAGAGRSPGGEAGPGKDVVPPENPPGTGKTSLTAKGRGTAGRTISGGPSRAARSVQIRHTARSYWPARKASPPCTTASLSPSRAVPIASGHRSEKTVRKDPVVPTTAVVPSPSRPVPGPSRTNRPSASRPMCSRGLHSTGP
jgi:GH15 family glucan-1,4-alpha-glucosidase